MKGLSILNTGAINSQRRVQLISDERVERIHFSIFDQLLRSATSIGANVVEAKSGSSTKDFKNFYTIALKAANETKYWICLVRDTKISGIEKTKLDALLKEADELSKIIASIILNLGKKWIFDFHKAGDRFFNFDFCLLN